MYKTLNMVGGEIGLGLAVVSLIVWVGLLGFRGQFWQSDQRLADGEMELPGLELDLYPSVCAVVPARNEAQLLPVTLRSLLEQDYPGSFSVILVDDQSTDGTTNVAQQVAQDLNKRSQLEIIAGVALPSGWTGKLWAIEQGIHHAQTLTPLPDYFLLTDADIEHSPNNIRQLVIKAQQENLELASVMVLLRCKEFWEQLLIPAFVFFFQKLYPFRWVNNPHNSTAAAAGGCILIRREALTRIGGIQAVRQALIDDCALAQAVKGGETREAGQDSDSKPQRGVLPCPDSDSGHQQSVIPASSTLKIQNSQTSLKSRIWLGLSSTTRSLRAYSSLASVWEMVARTAYTQLNYSPLLLLGTLCGMVLIYLVPPVSALLGGLLGNWPVAIAGLGGWLLMALAYLPTVRFYQCSPLLALCLPWIAFLYTLMTLDSAIRHWQGRGGAWKGRVYLES